jgi:hypothetical protein
MIENWILKNQERPNTPIVLKLGIKKEIDFKDVSNPEETAETLITRL